MTPLTKNSASVLHPTDLALIALDINRNQDKLTGGEEKIGVKLEIPSRKVIFNNDEHAQSSFAVKENAVKKAKSKALTSAAVVDSSPTAKVVFAAMHQAKATLAESKKSGDKKNLAKQIKSGATVSHDRYLPVSSSSPSPSFFPVMADKRFWPTA